MTDQPNDTTAGLVAALDQDISAGRDALDQMVDGIRRVLTVIGPETTIMGLVLALEQHPPETSQSLAALAVVRLAQQPAKARPDG